MKKTRVASIFMYFVCIYYLVGVLFGCNSGSSNVHYGVDSARIANEADNIDAQLKQKFNIAPVAPTEPIPDSDAKKFINHFNLKFNTISEKGMWVDKSVIFDAFKDPSIDGFIITPISYDTDGVTPKGFKYKKDEIGFLI